MRLYRFSCFVCEKNCLYTSFISLSNLTSSTPPNDDQSRDLRVCFVLFSVENKFNRFFSFCWMSFRNLLLNDYIEGEGKAISCFVLFVFCLYFTNQSIYQLGLNIKRSFIFDCLINRPFLPILIATIVSYTYWWSYSFVAINNR